jgi:hypothetical protein
MAGGGDYCGAEYFVAAARGALAVVITLRYSAANVDKHDAAAVKKFTRELRYFY